VRSPLLLEENIDVLSEGGFGITLERGWIKGVGSTHYFIDYAKERKGE